MAKPADFRSDKGNKITWQEQGTFGGGGWQIFVNGSAKPFKLWNDKSAWSTMGGQKIPNSEHKSPEQMCSEKGW